MGLDADIRMMILIGFLYLSLPVLACAAAGATIGFVSPEVGKLRGVCLGLGIGTLGIFANVAFAFVAGAVWERMYPSSIQLSETRVVFPFYSSYHIRDAIYIIGPSFLAAGYVSAVLVISIVFGRTPFIFSNSQLSTVKSQPGMASRRCQPASNGADSLEGPP